MIAQVFGFLAQFWRQLIWWCVVDAEQVGFIRRFGTPRRTLHPGLRWKWPVIDVAELEDAREYTLVADPQSLTTKDGIEVVVRATVKCNVFDAKRYFLNCSDGRNNVQDLVGGELGWLVQRRTAREVRSGAILPELVKRAARASRPWGIHIESIRFLDAVAAPSFRLWQNQISSSGQE